MHHLGGTFLIENSKFKLKDKYYYSFSIIFPQKTRDYFIEDKCIYSNWILSISKALGNIDITSKYELSDLLGNGKYGVVRKAINKITKDIIAVKIVAKEALSSEEMYLAKQEIHILKICQHVNLIMLNDIIETNDEYYIFVEYCKGKDLFTWLSDRSFKITEKQAKHLVKQILLGVEYLHHHGIIHRDLKPENILLLDNSDYPHLKISDFGLSKIVGPNQLATEPYGTLSYASPELLSNKPYDMRVDIWAIGIITYLFLVGHLPFDGKTVKAIVEQTVSKETPFPYDLWKEISKGGRSFVDLCLVKNPNERISIKEALESPWMT